MPLLAAGWVWRRKWWALAVVVLALGGGAFGAHRYAEGEWEKAKAEVEDGKPEEARPRLKVCETVWPFSPEVLVLSARAARLTNDYPTAEAYLNRCRKLQGGTSEPVQLEFLLMRLQGGELDELADGLFAEVDKGHPDSPAILETLAFAYFRHNRYKLAYGAFTKWIDLRPNTARAYYWRGITLEQLNHPKAALDDYAKAIDLDADLIPVRLRVAEMYLEDKKPSEATPHLEHIVRLAPDDPRVKSRLGVCRFYEGNFTEARRLLEESVTALPHDPVVLIHLARLDKQDQRYPEAEGWLKKLLAFDPSDSEARYTLAEVYRLSGRDADAEAEMKEYNKAQAMLDRVHKLLKEKADDPTGTADDHAEIAGLMFALGHDREGLYWLNKALEKNPAHPRSRALAVAYKQREADPEAARRVFANEPDPKK